MKITWSIDKHTKAWQFAALAHKGQTYGGAAEGEKFDYLTHIGTVTTEIIWALGKTEEVVDGDLAVQCALLHDILEDTTTTYEKLVELFGKAVADGVQALTKDKKRPTKALQMEDSLGRILLQPKEVWMVKMADRIANLYHPPFYWDRKKRQAYQEEARVIYEALHQANEPLGKRLMEKIEGYERFF